MQLNQRKGAKTQGFRLLSTVIRRVSYRNLCLHRPVPCAFASWRLCVNFRFMSDGALVAEIFRQVGLTPGPILCQTVEGSPRSVVQ